MNRIFFTDKKKLLKYKSLMHKKIWEKYLSSINLGNKRKNL